MEKFTRDNKFLLYILTIFMLLLTASGIFNFYYIQKVDQRYTKLLNKALADNTTTQQIAANGTVASALFQELLYTEDSLYAEKLVVQVLRLGATNDTLYTQLQERSNAWALSGNLLKRTLALRKICQHERDSIIDLCRQKKNAEAKEAYDQVFQPDVQRYRDCRMQMIKGLRSGTETISDSLTDFTNRIGYITLALTVVPITIIGMTVLFLVVFIARIARSPEMDPRR